MKSILKRIKGTLKAALIFSPLLIPITALGTGIYFAVDGVNKMNAVVEETEYQQTIEETSSTPDDQDEELLKADVENNPEWINGNNEFMGGLFGGVDGGLFLGFLGVANYISYREDIKDIIAQDFEEAAEIDRENKQRKLEKMKQEEDEYNEEIKEP